MYSIDQPNSIADAWQPIRKSTFRGRRSSSPAVWDLRVLVGLVATSKLIVNYYFHSDRDRRNLSSTIHFDSVAGEGEMMFCSGSWDP